MKWKVSNTLFVLSILIFAIGVAFNYAQVKQSVESSLEKARRMKREKSEARKREEEIQEEEYKEDINEEIITIINNKDGE